ncbi:MAG: tyrosine-protein phosphatase [Chitinophagaceae bacterium]
MFSFFRKNKNLELFPFHLLKTDMHSHLIPGIDDGSPNVETSFHLMQGLYDLGYEKLITSPHVMQDLYPNNAYTINNGYSILKSHWKKDNDLPIKPAAEYFLDDHFFDTAMKGEQLLTIKNNLLLFEISFASPPLGLREMLFELQLKGFELILAHPERYSYMHFNPKKEFEALKNAGCYFQCNLLSFSGYYGKPVRDAAEFLVKEGMVDFLGTDLHHERHLENLKLLPYTSSLQRLMDSGRIQNASL